jgi:hypothetical protein
VAFSSPGPLGGERVSPSLLLKQADQSEDSESKDPKREAQDPKRETPPGEVEAPGGGAEEELYL